MWSTSQFTPSMPLSVKKKESFYQQSEQAEVHFATCSMAWREGKIHHGTNNANFLIVKKAYLYCGYNSSFGCRS